MTDARAITKVFMSYSRRDHEIVSRLVDALEGVDDIDVFRDTEDILPTEEWKGRLEQLIAQADTIVFALSPHSAVSEVCAWEIEYAESLNKRIAPIVIDDVEPTAIPAQLTKYNYIFFTHGYDFDAALGNLITALNTDIDWIREHTRIGELASRWDQQRKLGARLLRGQELADAERWIASQPPNAPGPTQTHRDFVVLSRRAATRRQRYWVGGSLAALLVTSILMVFAFVQMLEADAQRGVAEEQRTEAEEQRAEAQRNATLAEQQRGIAEEQRAEAETQRAEAVRNAALAQANAELAAANEQRANRERDQAERERAIAEYRAALLSANEAKSLAGDGEVNEALLLLLESAASLDPADVPETVLIAFDRVLESAQGQTIVAIPGNGTAFNGGDIVYYHDPASGDLLRFDGGARLDRVATLDATPAALGGSGDGSQLIIASRDRTVWTVDAQTGERMLVGRFDPLPQAGERTYDRESIDIRSGDLIVWQLEYSQGDSIFGVNVQIMDLTSGQVHGWDVADAALLGYIVQSDGARYLAPSAQMQTEALAYRVDLAAGDLVALDPQASGVPRNLSAMACLGEARPGDEVFTDEINRRFEEDFPFAMTCERFGEHLLLTEQFWSSGGGYQQYRVVRPDGTSIDAIETLRGFAQVDEVVDGLAWAAIERETGRISLIYGRELYVFDEYGIILNTTLPYPPEFAQFLSATKIAVVQPRISEIRVFTISDEPATLPGASVVAVDGGVSLPVYNIGNCAGFQTDWAFGPLTFPDGDSVSFEGTPDSAPTMVIAGANGAKTVDFSPDYSLCVQFSRDLRWLLVRQARGVTMYDFDAVRATGGLDAARIGDIVDPTMASAFFIGASTDLLTGHTDQRVVRWTRDESGDAWAGEEIYRGDAPIVYAEPDDTGEHLLIMEASGQSYYHAFYYSLVAGETWLDLGTAYKYVHAAFTDDMSIDYYGHLNDEDRRIITPLGLDDLVRAAGTALSAHCGPGTAGDYASSPCWPKSLSR